MFFDRLKSPLCCPLPKLGDTSPEAGGGVGWGGQVCVRALVERRGYLGRRGGWLDTTGPCCELHSPRADRGKEARLLSVDPPVCPSTGDEREGRLGRERGQQGNSWEFSTWRSARILILEGD